MLIVSGFQAPAKSCRHFAPHAGHVKGVNLLEKASWDQRMQREPQAGQVSMASVSSGQQACVRPFCAMGTSSWMAQSLTELAANGVSAPAGKRKSAVLVDGGRSPLANRHAALADGRTGPQRRSRVAIFQWRPERHGDAALLRIRRIDDAGRGDVRCRHAAHTNDRARLEHLEAIGLRRGAAGQDERHQEGHRGEGDQAAHSSPSGRARGANTMCRTRRKPAPADFDEACSRSGRITSASPIPAVQVTSPCRARSRAGWRA